MTVAVVLANVLADWADWIAQFWDLNVDRWVSAGWVVTAVLTILACIGMVLRIFTSYKDLNP